MPLRRAPHVLKVSSTASSSVSSVSCSSSSSTPAAGAVVEFDDVCTQTADAGRSNIAVKADGSAAHGAKGSSRAGSSRAGSSSCTAAAQAPRPKVTVTWRSSRRDHEAGGGSSSGAAGGADPLAQQRAAAAYLQRKAGRRCLPLQRLEWREKATAAAVLAGAPNERELELERRARAATAANEAIAASREWSRAPESSSSARSSFSSTDAAAAAAVAVGGAASSSAHLVERAIRVRKEFLRHPDLQERVLIGKVRRVSLADLAAHGGVPGSVDGWPARKLLLPAEHRSSKVDGRQAVWLDADGVYEPRRPDDDEGPTAEQVSAPLSDCPPIAADRWPSLSARRLSCPRRPHLIFAAPPTAPRPHLIFAAPQVKAIASRRGQYLFEEHIACDRLERWWKVAAVGARER